VHPFAQDRLWPLGLALVFVLASTMTAGWLTTRRDIGGGLVPDRAGRPDASPLLAGTFAFAGRLQRSALIGWAVGMAVLGAVYGSFGQDVLDMIEENPDLARYFEEMSGGASVTDAYFGIITMFTALVSAGFTVSSVLRMRAEESDLRAEPLLATPLSRIRWSLTWLAVTGLGTAAVLVASGLASGLMWAVLSDDPEQVAALTGASLSYLPALLVLGGFGFLLFGWLPRLAGATWAAAGLCFVLGWMGDLLSLPEWLLDSSPFAHIPLVPTVAYDATPLLAISGITVALLTAGLAGFTRRDIKSA
jgi:ABC-2 type transport system permease protein